MKNRMEAIVKDRNKEEEAMDMADTASNNGWHEAMEADASPSEASSFMNDISTKLKRPRLPSRLHHPFRGAPDFWNAFEWYEEERIERFTANFMSAGGHVERLATMEDAQAFY